MEKSKSTTRREDDSGKPDPGGRQRVEPGPARVGAKGRTSRSRPLLGGSNK